MSQTRPNEHPAVTRTRWSQTWWTVAYAVATTIEAFGEARPLWLAVGVTVTVISAVRTARPGN